MTNIVQPIINFLSEVGIVTREESIDDKSFLPDVRVLGGKLMVDRTKLK